MLKLNLNFNFANFLMLNLNKNEQVEQVMLMVQKIATGLEPRTAQFVNEHSTFWFSVRLRTKWYNHLNFRFRDCFEQEIP